MGQSRLEKRYPASTIALTEWWADAMNGVISWQDVAWMLHGSMMFTIEDEALHEELSTLHVMINFFLMGEYEKFNGLKVVSDE